MFEEEIELENVTKVKHMEDAEGNRTVTHVEKEPLTNSPSVSIALGFVVNCHSIGVISDEKLNTWKTSSCDGLSQRSPKAGEVELQQFISLGNILGFKMGDKEKVKGVLSGYGILKLDQ